MILLIKKDTVPNVRNQIALQVNAVNQMYENERFQESLNEIGRYDFALLFINCKCLWLSKTAQVLS